MIENEVPLQDNLLAHTKISDISWQTTYVEAGIIEQLTVS